MRKLLRFLVGRGLVIGGIAGVALGLFSMTIGAAAPLVLEVTNACDALITDAEAPPGTLIKLMGPTVHECDPTFDPATGELLTGNGITVEADGVTLDLNGRSIHSTANVAAEGDALGLDVENAGVAIGGKNIKVTNSSSTPSVVDNFTANFDIKAEASELVGALVDHDGNSATPQVFNLVGGNAHGGGALAIDKSKQLTVDTVKLTDLSEDGDNGIDLKRSESITIKNSHIEGIFTGVRARGSKSVSLTNNVYISGNTGSGIETIRLENSTISGNTIADNVFNGVDIGTGSKFVSITGNVIKDNGGCGIEISPSAQNITQSGNTFSGNAGGNVC